MFSIPEVNSIKIVESSEELSYGLYNVRMLSPDDSPDIIIERIEISKKSLKLYCIANFTISKATVNTLYSDLTSLNLRTTTGIFRSNKTTVLVFPNFSSLRSRTLRLLLFSEESKPKEVYIEISDLWQENNAKVAVQELK